MCSDHIEPWSARQGHSGFAWSWLGAALATTGLRFGRRDGARPALPPGHHRARLGHPGGHVSGPVLDGAGQRREHQRAHHRRGLAAQGRRVSGGWRNPWRSSAASTRRSGHAPRLGHGGARPDLGAAGDQTCSHCPGGQRGNGPPRRGLGRRTDHGQPAAGKAEGMLAAYRDTGGRGPAALQVHLSWAPTEAAAVAIGVDQWRTNIFAPPSQGPGHGRPFRRRQRPRPGGPVAGGRQRLRRCRAARPMAGLLSGPRVRELYLHFVGQEQPPFIEAFAEHVLPQLRPAAGPAPFGTDGAL